MATQQAFEKRYSPLIILLLVAALVAVIALWARDKAGSGKSASVAGVAAA